MSYQDPAHPDAEVAQLRADNALLREGIGHLLHQLAAAKEWRAMAVLGAIVGGFGAVMALRWAGL